jgi:hypothetical protein
MNSTAAITRIPAMPVEVPIPTFADSLSFAVDFTVGVDSDEVRVVVGIEELAKVMRRVENRVFFDVLARMLLVEEETIVLLNEAEDDALVVGSRIE